MANAVEVHNVSHVYVNEHGAKLALGQIQLNVEAGEFVALVGPSGCGKTTLLSIIAGLIEPSEGTVRLFGQPVAGPTPRVGYMLQQDYLFPWRTIRDNILIGLEVMGQLTPIKREYALQLLDEMGLSAHAGSYPSELSGGMRQRVALVRTLATEPDILFLDEPFSALDFQTKLQLENLIYETLRKHRKTALLVTHDIAEAIAMSNRVIILAPNPGTVYQEVDIPASLAELLPTDAREQDGFQPYFRQVWQAFVQMERSKQPL
ncbi:NitT/TauT family transport system ATP-binding protein [Paenibacillus taihuensis]|uniref:NitT/TauT family transport system ATP-binding protein n=1 Tax=Paenibacillus taihuensis TaxID=1156355 RepID=A0A3D9R288_9BACL|nr:ABC transporter ATP-binding protein [Paenibacillus taihuensis]REE68798.1 NitT/TauT family transport system ATP-binding protein [Paenibacillus taihuensis]